MKKILFLSMLVALVGFAACTQSDDVLQPQTDELAQATFRVQSANTRATVSGLTRYIVETYEAKDLSATPQRVESSTGSLTVTLKKDTEYTFLFWADFGTAASEGVASSGYYNTASLQAVQVTDGKLATVGERAYCLALSFNSKDFEANKAVVLKNAVAELNLIEAAGLVVAGNTVTVTYPGSSKLNVGTGVATEATTTAYTHTFTDIAQVGKDGNIATDYLLAPQGSQTVANISVQLNAEAAKTISNVPFQCNYRTNIKGEYSNLYASTFTISSEVEDYTDQEKPLELPATKTITLDGVAFDFVLVKAGTFQMGTPGVTDNEEAPCWVKITKDYYIGKTEVTQAQYEKIMGSNPSDFNGSTGKEPAAGETQANRPVENMTWNAICTDDGNFLNKMNAKTEVSAEGTVRLPSEAQWEYAARGGHKAGAFMQWPGTDTEDNLRDYAWFFDQVRMTHEVGMKSPNILGIYDMAGNVGEWCSSYITDNYPTGTTEENPAVDPDENTTGTYRVLRGGGYFNPASYCRSAIRFYTPSGYGNHIGFRLVLVPKV